MNSDPFRGQSEGESHRPHSSEAQRDEQVTICGLSGRMTPDLRISALDRKFGSLRITNGMDAAAIGFGLVALLAGGYLLCRYLNYHPKLVEPMPVFNAGRPPLLSV